VALLDPPRIKVQEFQSAFGRSQINGLFQKVDRQIEGGADLNLSVSAEGAEGDQHTGHELPGRIRFARRRKPSHAKPALLPPGREITDSLSTC